MMMMTMMTMITMMTMMMMMMMKPKIQQKRNRILFGPSRGKLGNYTTTP